MARDDQQEVRRLVARALRAADASGTAIRTLRFPASSERSAVQAATDAAAGFHEAGFVPIRAGLAPDDSASAVADRHVALLLADDRDATGLALWIRRLAQEASRGHVVADFRPAGPRIAMRPAASRSHATRRRACADVALARGQAFLRRGRLAAGERWLRAAMENGRRRGDEEGELRAFRPLAELLASRDRWKGLHRAAIDLLGRLEAWEPRAEVGAAAVQALAAVGDLAAADALAAALLAEARADGRTVPGRLRAQRAEVLLWQGRFEEAAAECASGAVSLDAASPGERVVPALVQWACGEPGGLERAQQALAVARGAGRTGRSCDRLGRACAAEVCLADGRADAALSAAGRRPRSAGEAPLLLEEALLEWIRARASDDAGAARAVRVWVQRSGAFGVTRWGLGRTGMHLLHAMPTLLNVLHDAEDEVTILTESCRWLRAQARALGVGIVTADGTRLIAADGLARADLDAELVREAIGASDGRLVARDLETVVASPMRWSGAAIGFVVARGASGTSATLTEAAATLAALTAPALRARLDAMAVSTAAHALTPEILGHSPAMAAIREAAARAAATAFPVLVDGESGTGKELVARAVHRLSARRDRRFCAVNCAALTDELVEAELFGHTRGAFTGAIGIRAGLFEEAHLGTLFLDEVSELSPRAQAKVLRVLQEREIRRIGENGSRPVDVRIVAATNRPLAEAVARGQFREDLLFRLAVVRIRLPPLRDRVEDIPPLAQVFWRRLAAEAGRHAVLGPDALGALTRHHWPGNVRELQNAIAALVVLAPSRGRVTARHVAQVLTEPGEAVADVVPLEAARRGFERRLVLAALARHAGRQSDAARELGLTRQGLAKAMRRLGLVAAPDAAGVA